jgi:hypothetical protein
MSDVSRACTPVLQRAGTNHCWAAVIAMITGRTGQSQVIIDDVIAQARSRGVPVNQDGSLEPANGPRRLASGFGLTCTDLNALPNVPDGNYFAGLLARRPFGIFGNRPGVGLHAVAIYRLSGDFAALGTTMLYGVDPMTGQFSRTLFDMIAQGRGSMNAHYLISG